jgi:hypothetical protein
MGVGYYVPLTQWSNGTYPNATNHEDDLAIIIGHIPYRSDVIGDRSSAAILTLVDNVENTQTAIIETNTDIDWFTFTLGDTRAVEINVLPGLKAGDANTDVLLKLYKGNDGTPLEIADKTANPVTYASLTASINAVLNSGTYYISVEGTGFDTGIAGIYSDYASIGKYKLSVTAGTTRVTGVTIAETLSIPVGIGTTETLVATLTPENTSITAVTWRSSDESIATIDADGKITPVAIGTTTITVTTVDGGYTDTCVVTVRAPSDQELCDAAFNYFININANYWALIKGENSTTWTVKTPLTTPETETRYGTSITYSTSNSTVLTATGVPIRPAYPQTDASATFFLRFTKGAASKGASGYPLTIPSYKGTLKIDTQPANASVTETAITGSLTVAASADEGVPGAITHQWYKDTDTTAGGGTKVEAATSAEFTIPSDLLVGQHYYYCEIAAVDAAPILSDVATVTVGVPPTVVTFTAAQTGGTSGTADSTGIVLTFSTSVTGLTADKITITNGTGAAVKGTLSGSGTTWTIALTSVTTEGNISVDVADWTGFDVTTSAQTVAVYKDTSPTQVTYTAAQTGGTTGTADSTGIVLTFSTSVTGLTADKITITNGTGAAVKGALSGSGTSWTIALTSVTTEGDVTVNVVDWIGFDVTTSAQTVAIYKDTYAPPLSSDATLSALAISGVALAPAFNPSQTSYTASVANSVTSVTVTATKNNANATVTVYGGTALLVGANTITIHVKAQDGTTTKTYTITITREVSSGSGNGGYPPPVNPNPPVGQTTPVVPADTKAETPGTAPAADNNAQVTYTPSGGTAKVDLPTAKVDEIINKSENDIADIDLSKVKGITEAQLPVKAIEQITESDVGLSVALPQGEVTLDVKALTALSETAEGNSITIKVEKLVPAENLNAKQLEVVGDNPVYDISVMSGGQYIRDFGDGLITISIPYKLKAGEKASGIKVYYVDADGNIQQMDAVYDEETQCAIFTTNHLSTYYISYEAWENTYPDITGDEWFYDYVEYVSENGIMGGTDKGFEPNTALTRATFVTILYRYAKPTHGANTTNFADVPLGEWYSDPIAWAAGEGIVSGTNSEGTIFEPNRNITREEMMTILFRFAKWQGNGPSGEWNVYIGYNDYDQISGWAKDSIMWAESKKIIGGKPGNVFDPQGKATRAEAAVVITKYIEATK